MNSVHAKKHLGQHFLIDESVAKSIADSLTEGHCKDVLEIGPGMGMLTKYLLQKDLRLTAIELDSESVAYLNKVFISTNPALRVVEADFLKQDMSLLFGLSPFAIIGNFPYNISSQILFKALEYRQQIPELLGMFQKEVAQRVTSAHGNKTYGILSVLLQAFYDTKYLFTVDERFFSPPPKVKSGVIHLVRKENYQLPCSEKLFFNVVKTAFNQRRKMLKNSLKKFGLPDTLLKDTIFTRRPEQLSVAAFVELTQKIECYAI